MIPVMTQFVPTDVNRVPVQGTLPPTPRAGYLPEYRLVQIREHAVGYLINGATAVAMHAQDVVALLDELRERRDHAPLPEARRSWWRRLGAWLRGAA